MGRSVHFNFQVHVVVKIPLTAIDFRSTGFNLTLYDIVMVMMILILTVIVFVPCLVL